MHPRCGGLSVPQVPVLVNILSFDIRGVNHSLREKGDI